MSQATDILENRIIDHIFRATTFTAPTGLRVKLYTAAPGEVSGTGTEVTGTGYAYAALNPSVANWLSTNGTTSGASSGTGGQTSNAAQLNYSTPGGNWSGPITHFGISDQADALFVYGTLTASKTVNNGDPAPYFAASALTVTVA
jgi:hypothetical protein